MMNAVIRSAWPRPAALIVSAAAAGLVTLLMPDTPMRPAVTLWFLLICPGLALVPLFHLDDLLAEAVLCVAMSLAVDALIGGVALYAGGWSMTGIFSALLSLTIGGAILQIAASSIRRRQPDDAWRQAEAIHKRTVT